MFMLGSVVFVAELITGNTHSSQAFEQICENPRFRAGRGLLLKRVAGGLLKTTTIQWFERFLISNLG
jgi:hypothetical protein